MGYNYGIMPVEQIELHQANYSPDQLGCEVFPDILEGRERPAPIFDQEVNKLFHPTRAQQRALAAVGIMTLSDLLSFPSGEFMRTIPQTGSIRDKLHHFLTTDLAVGAEGRLLTLIFPDSPLIPLPPRVEPARNLAVQAAVLGLPPKQSEVMVRRFGILTGVGMSMEKVALDRGINPEAIKQLQTRALRVLRHYSRSLDLSIFAPLPSDSLGKEIFGLDFGYQINQLIYPLNVKDLTLEDLNFAPYVTEEFPSMIGEWKRDSHTPLALLLRSPKENFSEPTYREIRQTVESLRRSKSPPGQTS